MILYTFDLATLSNLIEKAIDKFSLGNCPKCDTCLDMSKYVAKDDIDQWLLHRLDIEAITALSKED